MLVINLTQSSKPNLTPWTQLPVHGLQQSWPGWGVLLENQKCIYLAIHWSLQYFPHLDKPFLGHYLLCLKWSHQHLDEFVLLDTKYKRKCHFGAVTFSLWKLQKSIPWKSKGNSIPACSIVLIPVLLLCSLSELCMLLKHLWVTCCQYYWGGSSIATKNYWCFSWCLKKHCAHKNLTKFWKRSYFYLSTSIRNKDTELVNHFFVDNETPCKQN